MIRPVRRLSVLDVMILVAFLAAGLSFGRLRRSLVPGASPEFAWMISGTVFALAATLALIPLRLQSPRPRLPFRTPGLVAACAVGLALLLILGDQAYRTYILRPAPSLPMPNRRSVDLFLALLRFDLYAFTVAGAWMALAASGRWRPEPDWIDRAGCIMGICWIVWPFVAAVGL